LIPFSLLNISNCIEYDFGFLARMDDLLYRFVRFRYAALSTRRLACPVLPEGNPNLVPANWPSQSA
jgi:hypothetical protein